MRIVLVTGGARSGKSAWAEAEAVRLGGDDVAVLATARPLDREMAARIRAHRAARPAAWRVVEEPLAVDDALARVATEVVVLDCVTVWVANLLDEAPAQDDATVLGRVDRLLDRADERSGALLVVTNEVGLGIVPANALARRYRDLLGMANRLLAARADRVVLMVAGLALVVRDGAVDRDSEAPPHLPTARSPSRPPGRTGPRSS